MNTWARRIKLRMKELDMTQEVLARKMGITRGAITHYLAGRRIPPLKQFQKIATVLKIDPAWLQYGSHEETKHATKKSATKNENTELTQIPLLSWERAADFINNEKLTSSEIKEFLQNLHTDKPRLYGLRVKGDFMFAPLGYSNSFHEGSIIIIDPDKSTTNGSFVIALLPHSKELTFKQYVVDAGIHYLKPLNPQYPIVKIDERTHIYGVVVASINQF